MLKAVENPFIVYVLIYILIQRLYWRFPWVLSLHPCWWRKWLVLSEPRRFSLQKAGWQWVLGVLDHITPQSLLTGVPLKEQDLCIVCVCIYLCTNGFEYNARLCKHPPSVQYISQTLQLPDRLMFVFALACINVVLERVRGCVCLCVFLCMCC